MPKKMMLQELRQACTLTQVRMAKVLSVIQDGVSVWKRSELLLFTTEERQSNGL